VDLKAILTEAGFDLVHPFDANAVAREPGLAEIADAERPLGYLVGNTRALWPRLRAERRTDRELGACNDPFDRYTEQTCERIVGARSFYAHRTYRGVFLPFQRLAVAAGFGTLSSSQLVIHPTYGPWFALRAAVLVAGEPTTSALPVAACNCAMRCTAAFERACAVRDGEMWRAWLAVRDACCVGREHRYDDDQLEYHYTKDRSLLD
jgi:methylmalonic aciduria homocystinuria type C protein